GVSRVGEAVAIRIAREHRAHAVAATGIAAVGRGDRAGRDTNRDEVRTPVGAIYAVAEHHAPVAIRNLRDDGTTDVATEHRDVRAALLPQEGDRSRVGDVEREDAGAATAHRADQDGAPGAAVPDIGDRDVTVDEVLVHVVRVRVLAEAIHDRR